jgi:nitroimidazol reductase NimA-like FMN-containing flavoprotein (pyridoxamine 5'-phosphate oxidase superfamily)
LNFLQYQIFFDITTANSRFEETSMTKTQKAPSERTRAKRMHARVAYDPVSLYAVLDAIPLANVGYVLDGAPVVTPTLQWREGDHVYWHGSSASRMLRKAEGTQVCLTVSALDGFVMARSGMHHSANYRSAMVFGTAHKVEDPAEKEAKLKAFINGLFPGRWDVLRQMTTQELKATTILGMKIDEASAKVRNGPPGDDEVDYALPIWAGVIPIRTQIMPLVPDTRNLDGVEPPQHIVDFKL